MVVVIMDSSSDNLKDILKVHTHTNTLKKCVKERQSTGMDSNGSKKKRRPFLYMDFCILSMEYHAEEKQG